MVLTEYSQQIFDLGLLINILLIILILSSAITDISNKKIYNIQTYSAMSFGLVLGFAFGGWHGILTSLLGMLTGLALLFFFYMAGSVGAGDVKLLGAIGALKGTTFVLWTMFYTGLVGGIMALSIIIWKGTVRITLKNLVHYLRHPLQTQEDDEGRDQQYLPYGLAISSGCLWAFLTV